MEPRLAEGPQVDHAADGAILHVAASEQDWRTTTAPGLDAIMPGHELACIVLTVSSLEVAGVAATLSAHLAGAGIGCNILTLSGRDHLFVLNDQEPRRWRYFRQSPNRLRARWPTLNSVSIGPAGGEHAGLCDRQRARPRA